MVEYFWFAFYSTNDCWYRFIHLSYSVLHYCIHCLASFRAKRSTFELSETMGLIILVCFTLYYMAQMLLYSLPHLGVAFQYFNLVELKKPAASCRKLKPWENLMPAQDQKKISNRKYVEANKPYHLLCIYTRCMGTNPCYAR